MAREILAVRGLAENTTPAFRAKLIEIADRRQLNPSYLAAVMSFETGGTFSPTIRPLDKDGHPISSAIGLIQFLESTAALLGTTTDALSQMTAEEQLDFVEAYYEYVHDKIHPIDGASLEDTYMAVLGPAAIGKPPSYAVYSSPSGNYQANSRLDEDQDGVITKFEATGPVRSIVRAAEDKPPIIVGSQPPVPPGPGNGGPITPLSSSLSLGEGAVAFLGAATLGLMGYDYLVKKKRRGRR